MSGQFQFYFGQFCQTDRQKHIDLIGTVSWNEADRCSITQKFKIRVCVQSVMYHQLSFIHSHLLVMLNRGRVGCWGCCACSYALLSYSWFPEEMTGAEEGDFSNNSSLFESWTDQIDTLQCNCIYALQLHCLKHTEKWFKTHCACEWAENICCISHDYSTLTEYVSNLLIIDDRTVRNARGCNASSRLKLLNRQKNTGACQ